MHQRRPGLSPGTSLILPGNVVDYVVAFDDFASAISVPAPSLMASPLIGLPLPPAGWSPRDFAPELIWHPMAWLPERLKRPLTNGDDVEPDNGWVLRVGLELQESGLYDQVSGSWFDVLTHLGIDPANADDAHRLSSWLAGGPDRRLDEFDLDELIFVEDAPEWSLEAAISSLEPLEVVARTKAARQLLAMCNETLTGDGVEPAEQAEMVGMMLTLGVWATCGDEALGARIEQVRERLDAYAGGLSDAGSPVFALSAIFADMVDAGEPIENDLLAQFERVRRQTGLSEFAAS
ncbi:hypothetical protein AZH51_12335 [Branchiibius sp. NY16-3462-2]|nr:hypothetical protein AZH51_12335 [Branchiibius sp. NY16-3462-2]